MKLQWLGYASFRLTESTDTTIVTDPFDAEMVGYHLPSVECDVITVSHSSPCHSHTKALKGDYKVFDGKETHDIKGVHIQSLAVGDSHIFKFGLDGVSVCHMGAIKEECSAEIVEEIMPVNILLVPVGGEDYTLDAEQAKEYVDNIMPDVVIPMCFRTKNTELDVDKVDEFLRLFDEEQIEVASSSTIEFDRYDFSGSQTKVIVPKRHK